MIKPLIESKQYVRIAEIGGSQFLIGIITEFDEEHELLKLESNERNNAQTYIIPLQSILNIRIVREKQ